jgi:thioester reductase-like protein
MEEQWLVTGFPALRARTFVRRALAAPEPGRLVLLVHPALRERAERWLSAQNAASRERLELVSSDPAAIDFGLSGASYLALAERITRVHHFYQSSSYALDERGARHLNVAGVRETIEFARVCTKLERLVHYSSVFVSGSRTGIVMEDELEHGQSFRSPAEESLALGEAMLRRAGSGLPLTVVRTAHVVGDSRTGEFDHVDGPYIILALLATAPDEVALPLPASVDATLHLVPVDFVAAAGLELGSRPAALGKTVHLVDARPLSVRRFVELAAQELGKRLVPGMSPAPIGKTLRGGAGLRLVRHQLRPLSSLLTTPVSYDDRSALELLSGSGVECPPLERYLPVLLQEVQTRARSGTLLDEQPEDGPHLVS